MANRERRLERAAWLMHRDLEELGINLRTARLSGGLTLRAVGQHVGVAPSMILKVERGQSPAARPELIARHAAAVGMRARIKVYLEGAPLWDAAQIALMREFNERIGPSVKMLVEQPVTNDRGDLRAFDATLDIPPGIALEFITRFHGCQAQLRAAHLKLRDSGVVRLIIVAKATHANRRAVAAAADVVASTFPLGTRAVMAALEQGRDPGANGLAFI